MYKITWYEQIKTYSKLENFSIINTEFSVTSHVNSNLEKSKKSLIGKLRLGILGISIELGRYQGLPQTERICEICQNDVESETHLLFDCPYYHELRVELYKKCPELLTESCKIR